MAGKEKRGAGMMKKELKKKWIRFENRDFYRIICKNIVKEYLSLGIAHIYTKNKPDEMVTKGYEY